MNVRKLSLTRSYHFEAVLVLAFLLVCGFNLWHHEMWRDEMQPWLFARDSASIPELFKNLHYETHPRLWYLILYGVARISNNPAAMQATHLMIIGLATTLLVRFAPLPLYLKALTVFGYFFVYEWGALSRNYALGVLCCFGFCARFPRREKGYLGLAAILFLATQSNHYAALLSAGLGGVLILEAWTKPEVWNRICVHKVDAALSLLLLLGGVCLAFWIGIPPRDHTGANFSVATSDWVSKLQRAFAAVWDGFVPWPGFSLLNAWGYNTHSYAFPSLGYQAILGVFLFPITILFFQRSRLILWAYLTGAIGLLLLAFVKTDTYPRHAGHFFLWFLICLWLAHYLPDSSESQDTKPFGLSRTQKLVVWLLLLIHIYAGTFLGIADYCYDFSCGKAVARYLERRNPQGLPIVSLPDYGGITLSAYSGLRIYYPDSDGWLSGSFVIENNKRRTNLNHNEIIQLADQFAAQCKQDFLLLVKDDILCEIMPLGNLHKETSFTPAMTDESYGLYRYERGSQGHPEEMIARCREALRLNPADADAHNNLGIVLFQQGQAEESMSQFREAFQIKPDLAGARNNLGDVLLQQGRMEEAIAQYRETMRIKPAYAEVHNFNLGNAMFQQGRMEEAILHYRAALRINPASAETHSNLGLAMFQKGRTEEAMAQYQEALRINPDYAPAHYNLGNALQQQGRAKEAIAQYHEALRIKPAYAEAHNNLGSALQQQGRTEESISQFQQALRINPDYALAHYNLGNALQQQGRTEEAIAQYRDALRINPAYPEASYNLGNALQQQGHTEEAIAQYHDALRINPALAEACCNLGSALQQQGRTEEALAQYRKALELKPEYADALNNLGILLLQQGRAEEAMSQFRAALQIDPSYAAAHYNLGLVLFADGRKEEAIGQYRETLQLSPTMAEAHSNLAKALIQQGQTGEAITHFQKALELQPDNAAAQNDLAWMLATAPQPSLRDGARAVELATKASRSSGGNSPDILRTLAAAYAAAGDFPKAVQTAQHALQLAEARSNNELASQLRREVQLYEAEQAYQAGQ